MAKTKAEYTVKQLRNHIAAGKKAVPVFGPGNPRAVRHEPRTRFDPKPWTDGVYRYFTWELTLEAK